MDVGVGVTQLLSPTFWPGSIKATGPGLAFQLDPTLSQGSIVKPVFPYLLFNIYVWTAEVGNTSNQ